MCVAMVGNVLFGKCGRQSQHHSCTSLFMCLIKETFLELHLLSVTLVKSFKINDPRL